MTDFTVASVKFFNELLPTPAVELDKTNRDRDGSIGAPIKCEITIDADSDIENMRWYLNPALFLPLGAIPLGSPTTDYLCEINGTPSIGTIFPMTLYTGGSPYEPQNRNLTCELEKTAADQVVIRLRFRLTMDLNSLVTGGVISNHARLLKPTRFDPAPVYGTGLNLPSVYRSTTRQATFRIKLMDGFGDTVEKLQNAPYRSRYYFKGLPNDTNSALAIEFPDAGPPYFNSGLFRGGVPVPSLSQYESTEIRIWWPYTVGGGNNDLATPIFCYLIRTDLLANVGSWLEDYGCDGVTIDTGTADGAVLGFNMHCMQPHQELVNIDGIDSVVHRFVAGTALDPSATYAAIFIVNGHPNTGSADLTFSNSFILPNLAANAPPTPIPMAGYFTGSLIDYNLDPETDNVVTTVVDNLVARVHVDTTGYESGKVGHPAAVDWDTDLDRVGIIIMNQAGTIIYGSRTFNKVGGVWVGLSGATANNLVVTDIGGGLRRYDFQIHNCMENLVGFPDFGGETVMLRWTFRVSYPSVSTSTNYIYYQQMEVMDFKAFTGVIESIKLFDFETGLPLQNLCDSDRVLVKVQLDTGQMDGLTWNLRAYYQLEGYGYSPGMQLKRPTENTEEESYPSPPGALTQLNDPHFESVPPTFDGGGFAQFVFYHGDIPEGERVRLYVIAEPEQNVCDLFDCAPDQGQVIAAITTDQVAAIEAAVPNDGDAYLLVDLPNGTPLVSPDPFEENTGNVIGWQSGAWVFIDIPLGDVIIDMTSGKRWQVHADVEGTTLYPSGKFAIEWLTKVRDGNGSAPHGSGSPHVLYFSEFTGQKIASTHLSNCRTYFLEVDSVGGGVVWVQIAGPIGGKAAYTTNATTFTNINARLRWECGGNVQGYSDVQNFA